MVTKYWKIIASMLETTYNTACGNGAERNNSCKIAFVIVRQVCETQESRQQTT
jgi:hypothetical protein